MKNPLIAPSNLIIIHVCIYFALRVSIEKPIFLSATDLTVYFVLHHLDVRKVCPWISFSLWRSCWLSLRHLLCLEKLN